MADYATVEDVAAAWGDLTLTEEKLVAEWIKTASNNLRIIGRQRGVNVDEVTMMDEFLERAAKDAVVGAVRRRLMNPDGVRQRSRTVTDGPFSDTTNDTIDSSISSGSLSFTDVELAWLPFRRQRTFRSFSVRSGFRP
ncbi:Gp19/Gp15/Gp42 family protein [Microbacterium sp. Kw_RZR3]|uniref:Gp19/Gp15/Gp42 family protein n=1 Tax=Microbacterium sp. Kw_RZR3 TaxID=3032903 RepID=UPI0023DBFFFE|nr:Gp19/Gp15/Gp42 family protein [Microbacterium sp. Kw_RZR3]MDF2045147.1 Gp19/Gp15/Gp42 family protein [Microbacterium sp. Kw_RZR3]